MPSNMGWCNRFCQLIEMLFMKLQICLIKTAILMWCTWMSVKYLACQYTTVWLRNKNHAKLTWYIISGVKTAFHNMIVSGFIIFIRPAQASASCCLSVSLCQWLGWEHTLLIGHADVAGEVRNEQITETTQSHLLGTLVREGAGILTCHNHGTEGGTRRSKVGKPPWKQPCYKASWSLGSWWAFCEIPM